MTTGLAIPVGVNTTGGAKLVSKDAQADKIIGLALSDLDSDNAFQQDIGLGADLIFDPALPAFRGKVRQRLLQIFDDFESQKLFKLVTSSIVFDRAQGGEQSLALQYINLESDEVLNFEKSFVATGR